MQKNNIIYHLKATDEGFDNIANPFINYKDLREQFIFSNRLLLAWEPGKLKQACDCYV